MGIKAGVDRSVLDCSDYVFVAVSVTTKPISVGTNSVGDYLDRVVICPLSSAAGAVAILDGPTTVVKAAAIPTASNDQMRPYTINIGASAQTTQGWVITTGANVNALAIGRFTNGGIKV